MILSDRCKQAVKAALAVVIAYAIALYMGWEKPYWAAWTALTISFLATRGAGLQKGLSRVLGAIVGAAVGFVLLGWCIQDRWLFVTFLSLYGAATIYISLGTKRYNYFWQQAGFFAAVVAFDGAFNPVNAFAVGIERVQESATGLIVYTLVELLLWPHDSRGDLENTLRALVTNLRRLSRDNAALMPADGDAAAAAGISAQVTRLQARLGTLLDAAEVDSWQVAEVRPAWRRCQVQITALSDTLTRLRMASDELRGVDLDRLVPALPALLAEIDGRLGEIERMLAGEPPARDPVPSALTWDEADLRSLRRFDRAALTMTHDQLQRLEVVTRALFATVKAITGLDRRATSAAGWRPPATRFSLDPDRLGEAMRVAASAWLMFLAVVYVPDVPTGLGTVGFATRLVMADANMASISIDSFFLPVATGIACAFPFYFFVMPQLSSYVELAPLIFGLVFMLMYLLHERRSMLWRAMIGYVFVSMIDITNEQSYSFTDFATGAVMWLVVITVLTVTEYIPIPHQPDRVFLRMVSRFFRNSAFLMMLGAKPQYEQSRLLQWRATFSLREVETLPDKLAAWGAALPRAALHDASGEEKVQALIVSLEALSHRLQALIEARAAPQSEPLVRELVADVRGWRTAAQDILGRLSKDPAAADPGALRSRLDALLARLEERIERALDNAVDEAVSTDEAESMYRLLGAYRGVSEALVEVARHAARLDWGRLREARF